MQLNDQDFSVVYAQRSCRNTLKSLFDIQHHILSEHHRGANYVSGPSLESMDIAFTTATQDQFPSPFLGDEVASLETAVSLFDTIDTITTTLAHQYMSEFNQCQVAIQSDIESLTLMQNELTHWIDWYESNEVKKSLITIPTRLAQGLHTKGQINIKGLRTSITSDYSDRLMHVVTYGQKLQENVIDAVVSTTSAIGAKCDTAKSKLDVLKSQIAQINTQTKEAYPKHTHSSTIAGNVRWVIRSVCHTKTFRARIPYLHFDDVRTKVLEESIEQWMSTKDGLDALAKALLQWIPKLIATLQVLHDSLSQFPEAMRALKTMIHRCKLCTSDGSMTPSQIQSYHRAVLYIYGLIDVQNLVHLKYVSGHFTAMVDAINQLLYLVHSQMAVTTKDI